MELATSSTSADSKPLSTRAVDEFILGKQGNMMSHALGLVGKSGFGREVMPLAESNFREVSSDGSIWYLDHDLTEPQFGGIVVMTEQEFVRQEFTKKYFNVAIADHAVRMKVAVKLEGLGCIPFAIAADNSIVLDRVDIGVGSILCSFTHITSDVKIGKYFHGNIYSYIAHDCVIGDYVTFAPRVSCNGNIHIHDNAYIGTGAVIKQGTPTNPLIIGEGAIVGMGAIVTKNVAPYTTVVGNPARPIERR